MATTTLNTRIQLKYDTYENWTANNPVLLAGEVAVTTVQSAQAPVSQVPAILFKVGDGTNNFNTLNWASAIAADVYPWAKASVKPTYQASEIEGLEDYISGQIEDTDTQYQIIASGTNGIQLQSRPKTGGAWTNVGSPITITYTLETGTTNGTVSFNGTEVAVKGLGSAAYTESSAYDAAGTAAGVQTAVIGTSGDQSSAITIYGTRKYAAEQATAAQSAAASAAKSYTDGQITQAKTDLIGTGDATSTTIKGAVAESKTYADTQIAAKIGSVYKPAGSVAFENLPTPAASLLGNVYNVTNAFTADAEFITSEQGTKYPAGTNVVVVEVEDAYYYDALTGIVDLSSYATQTWVNGQLQTQSENLIGNESGVTANTIQGAVVEAKGYVDDVVKVVSDEVDGILDGTMPITLPIASDTHLGGVIVGDGLSVDPTGTLSVDAGAGIPPTDTAQAGDVPTWDGEQVVWAAPSGDGGKNWVLLYNNTINISDYVQAAQDVLLQSCEGITEIHGIFATSEISGTIDGKPANSSVGVAIGDCLISYGRLFSTNANSRGMFNILNDLQYSFWSKASHVTLNMEYNSANQVGGYGKKPVNPDYEHIILNCLAANYAFKGEVELIIYGR